MLRDVKIEYTEKPIGLDTIPRFSWILVSEKNNTIQIAYHIQVSHAGTMLWDSGRVESDDSTFVNYDGTELEAKTIYEVKVIVWDNQNQMHDAKTSFETGLLVKENWKAKWITHELDEVEEACPVFVKKINHSKKIKAARIYATCLGVYEIEINGEKVGDSFMAPGWTSYHNRLQYQTYDVTELLKSTKSIENGSTNQNVGDVQNEIAITVGNGWYKGYLSFDNIPNRYGNRTSLLAMICLEYEDGSVDNIGTDTDWVVQTGLIRSSEIYHGEIQDFSIVKNTIGKAILFADLDDITDKHITKDIVSQESETVRITKRFSAIEKIITPKGELVIDFGQNMSGIVEIKLPKLKGNQLVIRHAEVLDKDGNFYTENLRQAKCTDTYIYDEKDVEKLVIPHFTFHGFRYICIEGVEDTVDMSRFTACAMHTDMEETGTFTCDNKLVNQLQSNIIWGQRGNFLDVPTDCPQRDERLGWTGDAQVFCGTAAYNFNTALFFKKWLHDVAVETNADYGVPHVVPNILGDQDGAAAWSDCVTIIPWTMYQVYGDKKFLSDQYESMKCWVEYIKNHCESNGLWQNGYQYGDWLALDKEESSDRTGATDRYLVANAYYAYSTKIVRNVAEVLGYKEDMNKYSILYDEIIDKINEEYITKSGRLVSETQTACVLMLYFEIAKPEYRNRIKKSLRDNLATHNNHLSTGFVGTPYLCHCLSEEGEHELAEAVFLKEDYPGWFYSVKKGATTIWERWNSILPDGSFDESGMNSLNHYAYGSIGSWLYEKVAGIQMLEPGYKRIKIKPTLTRGMTEVNATFDSVYGAIKSAWSCKNHLITMDITIPANTTALIVFPGKTEQMEVGSGSYHFEYETTIALEIERFNMDSTLGELVVEPLAVTLFNKYAPGMLEGPMIKFAYGMTLTELTAMRPDAKPMYEAVLQALNNEK